VSTRCISSACPGPSRKLKHGSLALMDAEMPVVVIAPNDELLEKLKANMQEVSA